MSRWTQHSYWLVVNGARDEYGLSLRDAREFYRRLRDVLDRPAFGTDLRKHKPDADRIANILVPPADEPDFDYVDWDVTVEYDEL